MADQALLHRSERWLDEVLLAGSKLNVDGDQADTWIPPYGLGDLAIMEIGIDINTLATSVADPTAIGVRIGVVDAAGSSIVDIAGDAPFRRMAANRLEAYISPDPLVLVRQGEKIVIEFPEVDINATPTGDLAVYVKCVRVRPTVVAQNPGPIQLVR